MNGTSPTPETARLFIALPAPESVQDRLNEAQRILRSHLPDNAVRWTPPLQIHLTLVFLGITPADHIPPLTANLAAACAPFEPLPLRAQGLGCFPERGTPRVLWAGVSHTSNRLSQLQAAVARAASGFGDNAESRNFSAHLTLGRVRQLPGAKTPLLRQQLQEMADQEFGDWTAGCVQLMRSLLSAEGARHVLVAEFPLSGRPG